MKNQDDAAATKGDIKVFLSTLATKDDLKAVQRELERRLSLESVKTNGRIDQLREDLRGESGVMVSGMFRKIDGFMSKIGTIDRAQVIADWRVAQMEKRVDAIESRPS